MTKQQREVDVCYVISHGFAARMVLHSGIVPRLRERGLRVAVVAENAEEEGMRALGKRLGFEVVQAPGLPARHAAERERLRRYLFEDVRLNPALRAKHERALYADGMPVWRRAQAVLYGGLNRLCQHLPAVRRGLGRFERRLLRNARVAEVLRRLQPRLLVSTYPVSPLEAAFVHEAQRQGVKTVGQLLSWDNITCKGRFSAVPETFLVWGPIMAEELRTHYDVQPEHITECGVAHFDAHHDVRLDDEVRLGGQPESRVRLGETLREMGLDPAHPYLFFGMSSPVFAPHEIDVVEWLAERVRAGDFGGEMQLVVRPHPQNVQGGMADDSWLPRLEALQGERVAVDYPSLADSRLAWHMKEEDLPHLARLLAGCSLCLNSGSTLSIDAVLHDKPVVMTAFDAGRALPWWQSARRVTDYPHLARLVGLGGVRVVRSFEELQAETRAYLADPGRDAGGRERTRREECGPADGRAAERVAEALARLAGRPTGISRIAALRPDTFMKEQA